eukprot:366474-Chlamydomonas_euryale.AAC.5
MARFGRAYQLLSFPQNISTGPSLCPRCTSMPKYFPRHKAAAVLPSTGCSGDAQHAGVSCRHAGSRIHAVPRQPGGRAGSNDAGGCRGRKERVGGSGTGWKPALTMLDSGQIGDSCRGRRCL